MVDSHQNYLKQIRKYGRRVFSEDRRRIQFNMHQTITEAYLCKTLSYSECKKIREYMRDKLSLDSLLGVKQLSLFDDLDKIDFEKYKL